MSLPAWPFLNDQDEDKATGRWGPGARPNWKSSLPSHHLSKTPPGTSSTSFPKPWPWPTDPQQLPCDCLLSPEVPSQTPLLPPEQENFLMGGLNVSACWLQLGVGAEAGDIQVPTDTHCLVGGYSPAIHQPGHAAQVWEISGKQSCTSSQP